MQINHYVHLGMILNSNLLIHRLNLFGITIIATIHTFMVTIPKQAMLLLLLIHHLGLLSLLSVQLLNQLQEQLQTSLSFQSLSSFLLTKVRLPLVVSTLELLHFLVELMLVLQFFLVEIYFYFYFHLQILLFLALFSKKFLFKIEIIIIKNLKFKNNVI